MGDEDQIAVLDLKRLCDEVSLRVLQLEAADDRRKIRRLPRPRSATGQPGLLSARAASAGTGKDRELRREASRPGVVSGGPIACRHTKNDEISIV